MRVFVISISLVLPAWASAATTYWNLFNIEGESTVYAAYATYATLPDMLNDENRTGVHVADGTGLFGRNIVGTGSDGKTYWNLFNIEGESAVDAAYATYATLPDMFNDENRTGVHVADGSGLFGRNIVGTGSDGKTYWNLFNIEGESAVDAAYVTYASLSDMLNDENRTGLHVADGSVLFGQNIVGSGTDGKTYWNLFNIEGETSLSAAFVTYATLMDMFNDENRTGLFEADGSGLFGQNIIGSGATIALPLTPVPAPPAFALFGSGLTALAWLARGRRKWSRS